ncbi:MAG: hypothetical protein KF893_18350, partial [Caldilineaceae bacterium]|nr:hypothetical protein [Caldilineaceae bacterium]
IAAVRDGSSLYYLLQDHLNSTARIVNSAGTTQSTTYYFPFGGLRAGSHSSLTTKRFTGQYHESSIPGGEGLYYYGARWYDARLGRFTSADSIVPGAGNPQAFNRYSYVFNNPLRFTDPTGHIPMLTAGDAGPACIPGYCQGIGGTSASASQTDPPVSTHNIVGYILGEMSRNPNMPVANRIRGYIQRSNSAMRLTSQLAHQEEEDKGIATLLLLAALANRARAYELWRQQVDYNAPWDHKTTIADRFGRYQIVGNHRYYFDVWSNIHYGYVGASVGFESDELLWGAGAAQFMNESRTNFSSPTYREVLSSPLATRLDYSTDQAAISLGIHLWSTYGSSLTQGQFMQELGNWTGLDRRSYP